MKDNSSDEDCWRSGLLELLTSTAALATAAAADVGATTCRAVEDIGVVEVRVAMVVPIIPWLLRE